MSRSVCAAVCAPLYRKEVLQAKIAKRYHKACNGISLLVH